MMQRSRLYSMLEWYRRSKNELLAEFDRRYDEAKSCREENAAQDWYDAKSDKLVTQFENSVWNNGLIEYKRMDELKNGWFLIVTDKGCYRSYCRAGAKIFKDVPNECRILGFIQD